MGRNCLFLGGYEKVSAPTTQLSKSTDAQEVRKSGGPFPDLGFSLNNGKLLMCYNVKKEWQLVDLKMIILF